MRISDWSSDVCSSDLTQPHGQFDLVSFEAARVPGSNQTVRIEAVVKCHGTEHRLQAEGNGPVNAFSRAMRETFGLKFRLTDYAEHTRSTGSDAEADADNPRKAPAARPEGGRVGQECGRTGRA